ncbi:MAG: protoporphyrinogen oxidase [Microthrixaceae bacterium]
MTRPDTPRSDPTRIAIIGGGITGLAAAWEASARSGVQVTVFEASDRPGGRILTSPMPGLDRSIAIDEGADAFLARVPDAVDLCSELGLADEMTQPATGRAKVFVDGALGFLPTDTVLGVPVEFGPLAESGLVSAAGVERASSEVDRDWAAPDHDVSIGEFLSERYGRELVDNVVAPLIGGINAGDVDRLSLASVTPQLASAAAEGGSLTLALRRRAAALAAASNGGTAPPPIFRALLGGTGRLIESLGETLRARGVALRLSSPVARIGLNSTDAALVSAGPDSASPSRQSSNNTGGPTVRLTLSDGSGLDFDAVIVCTPAPAAAELLSDLSAAAAVELRAITHSSVALVTMIYERAALDDADLDASGFLIPRSAGMLMTAASIGSSKWKHWNDGQHVVMRVSAGHSTDDRGETLGDDELLEGLMADLRATLGIATPPVSTRISRWRNGFAQYEVGHSERVGRIRAALSHDSPNVAVAGAAYEGLGIPACIAQGRSAVRDLLG